MTFLVPTRRNASVTWPSFRELEKDLEQLWSGLGNEAAPTRTWAPAIDLVEGKDAYTLHADLPGLSKEDIELSIKEDVVTLKGERKEAVTEDKEGYRHIERRTGSFVRSFRISEGIDAAKVTAKFENGVLNVTLPKPEESKPKQIDVKIK